MSRSIRVDTSALGVVHCLLGVHETSLNPGAHAFICPDTVTVQEVCEG